MALFPSGKGGGELVDYGYKGKGVTNHFLADANGNPVAFSVTAANGSERDEAIKLVDSRANFLKGRKITYLEADKGYDSLDFRIKLVERFIFPLVGKRGERKKSHIKIYIEKPVRWRIERLFAWMQKTYRRTVVRWERKLENWKAFLNIACAMRWLKILMR